MYPFVPHHLFTSLIPGGPGSNVDNLDPVSQSHLVELSVLAPSGNDAVAEDMKLFAEQLKPLVSLDKVDLSLRRPM